MNNHSVRVHRFEMHLSPKQYAFLISALHEAFNELENTHSPQHHNVAFSSTYSGFGWEAVAYSESLQNLMEFIGNISILLPSGVLDEADIKVSEEVVPLNPALETPEEDVIEVPTPQDATGTSSDFSVTNVDLDSEEEEPEDEDEEEEEYEDDEDSEDDEEEDSEDEEENELVPASNSGKKVFRLESPKRVKNVAAGVTVEEF